MKAGLVLLFAAFATFIDLTKEVPIRGSTLPPESDEINTRVEDQTTSTTSWGYTWWYYPTRRPPPLSPKDFPGRPGVATWKEIGLGSSKRNQKTTSPTAAGVSSGSQIFHHSIIILASFVCYFFY